MNKYPLAPVCETELLGSDDEQCNKWKLWGSDGLDFYQRFSPDGPFFLACGSGLKMVCCFHDALKTHFHINWAFKRIQYYHNIIIYSHNLFFGGKYTLIYQNECLVGLWEIAWQVHCEKWTSKRKFGSVWSNRSPGRGLPEDRDMDTGWINGQMRHWNFECN